MFGPNQTIPGDWYTNPEIDYLPSGTDYSTGKQGDQWRVFNPVTGKFDMVDGSGWRPGDGKTMWGFVDGNRVMIRKDVEGWQDTGGTVFNGDTYYDWTWGADRNTYGGDGSSGGTSGGSSGGTAVGSGGATSVPTTPTPPPTSGTPPPYQPPPQPPGVTKPTDDWFWTDPLDYKNAPQPGGDGSFEEGGPPPDTSWNWDYFREKAPGDRQWGGYDTDYQAFERYQPGMESPWGMPNIKGGNTDFYQQQFVNALRDEQGFRNRQRQAQERAANYTPAEAPTTDEMWSWAYGGRGLPDVKLGGGERENVWELGSQFTPGETTQADILRWAASNLGSKEDQNWYLKHLNNPKNTTNDSTYWSSVGDPNVLISSIVGEREGGFDLRNQRRMEQLFNAIYNQGGAAPYAPQGYASPISWGSDYQSAPVTSTAPAAQQAAPAPAPSGQSEVEALMAQAQAAPAPFAPQPGSPTQNLTYEDLLAEFNQQAPEIDWASELTPEILAQLNIVQ
jgi:hypothetical protein